MVRSKRGVFFYRERIDTPDGDFLDLDVAGVIGKPLPDGAPVVLLLHGLEGNARQPYALEIYRQLAERGVRSVGMNFRSCSGEINRTARMYHAGATDDMALVHDWLDRRFPGVPKGMVGVSLGANMLLKYLGERGAELAIRLRAAAVISPPFDLALGAAQIEIRPRRLYMNGFLKSIQAKVKAKAEAGESQIDRHVDVQAALAAQTLRELDEVCTAPLHGFRDAERLLRPVQFEALPGRDSCANSGLACQGRSAHPGRRHPIRPIAGQSGAVFGHHRARRTCGLDRRAARSLSLLGRAPGRSVLGDGSYGILNSYQ